MKTNTLLIALTFFLLGNTSPDYPTEEFPDCTCSPYEIRPPAPAGNRLVLSGKPDSAKKMLRQWLANGGQPGKIQELILAHGAALSSELARFNQVRRLRFESQRNMPLGDLTIFPNLESLILENSMMEGGESINEVLELKHLELIKSQLKGEPSPQGMRSIRNIRMHFSSWGKGVLPLASGRCLEVVSIDGMTAGMIALNSLDFSQLSCLKRVYINDTFGGITGFPKNWDAHRLSYCRFINMKWSDAQQEVYKRYRK